MKTILLAAAALTLLAAPACAVDFRTPLLQIDGTPLKENGTLGAIAEAALLAMYQDEQNLDGAEKTRRYWLAMKIHAWVENPIPGNNDLKLTDVERDLLKKLIGKAFGPIIVGQAYKLLDPLTVPPDAK